MRPLEASGSAVPLNLLRRTATNEVTPTHESSPPPGGHGPALLASFFPSDSWGVGAVPKAPPLVVAGGWAHCALASSSSDAAGSYHALHAPRDAIGGAPATSPLPEAGESSRAPPRGRGEEERAGRSLELAREHSAVRHDLLQEAASALGRLGTELADVDAHLEGEGLRLAREWRLLKVAIDLGCLQHERARAEVKESLAASRESCARALEEAQAANLCREAAEEREKELQASNAALEQQV